MIVILGEILFSPLLFLTIKWKWQKTTLPDRCFFFLILKFRYKKKWYSFLFRMNEGSFRHLRASHFHSAARWWRMLTPIDSSFEVEKTNRAHSFISPWTDAIGKIIRYRTKEYKSLTKPLRIGAIFQETSESKISDQIKRKKKRSFAAAAQ